MLKHVLAALLLTLNSVHALAVSTTFRVWGSPWLYSVPTSEFDKPLDGNVSDGTVIVHVLVTATATSAVDASSGRIHVNGNRITLCYKMKDTKRPPGAAVAALAYPQAIEYTIAGLTKKKYSFQVSRDCE